MKEKDLTKKVLADVADELSKVMDFEIAIETGRKTTAKQLKNDLIEAAKELREEDKISDESKQVLEFLGVGLPKPEPKNEKESATEKTNKKPAVKKAGGKDGPGIIGSILEFITASKKGIAIPQIHDKLTTRFPGRDGNAMLKTIKAQIGGKISPCRMEREKKVIFAIQGDKYAIK